MTPIIQVPCPLKWENLEETEDENVRFCNQREDKVYFCSTNQEAIKHAELGHCLAMERVCRLGFPMMVLGMSEEPLPEEIPEQIECVKELR